MERIKASERSRTAARSLRDIASAFDLSIVVWRPISRARSVVRERIAKACCVYASPSEQLPRLLAQKCGGVHLSQDCCGHFNGATWTMKRAVLDSSVYPLPLFIRIAGLS